MHCASYVYRDVHLALFEMCISCIEGAVDKRMKVIPSPLKGITLMQQAK